MRRPSKERGSWSRFIAIIGKEAMRTTWTGAVALTLMLPSITLGESARQLACRRLEGR